MHNLTSLIKKDDGQAMILVAILFTVLLGFSALVIDYGYLSLQKRELQNAADAAALAGVVDLSLEKDDQYEATVIKYVKNNSASMKDIPGTEIKNYVITEWNQSSNELTVTINYEYNLFFGKVFNFNKSKVAASATAKWETVVTNDGIISENLESKVLPIGIMLEDDLKVSNMINLNKSKNIENLGFIGFRNDIKVPAGGAEFYGYFGYYNYLDPPKSIERVKFDKFNGGFIKDSFAGDKVYVENSVGLSTYKDFASLEDQQKGLVKNGVTSRINSSIDRLKNPKPNQEEIMTAVIPVLDHKLTDRIGAPIRRSSNGFATLEGEHFHLQVVGYRKVILRDVVDEIDDKKVIGYNKDKKGYSHSKWNFNDFKSFFNKSNVNNISDDIYEDSIVVTFGERVDDLVSNQNNVTKKIVYRLVK